MLVRVGSVRWREALLTGPSNQPGRVGVVGPRLAVVGRRSEIPFGSRREELDLISLRKGTCWAALEEQPEDVVAPTRTARPLGKRVGRG
jgi:hypothetical protein